MAHALGQLQLKRVEVRAPLVKHSSNRAIIIVEPAGVGIPEVPCRRDGWKGRVSIVHAEGLVHTTRADISSHGREAGGELKLDVEIPLRHVIAFRAGIRIGLAQFIRWKGWQNAVKKRAGSGVLDGGILKKGRCLSD